MTFSQQYVNGNQSDGAVANGTDTKMKGPAQLALENGATMDEIFEVILMIFSPVA